MNAPMRPILGRDSGRQPRKAKAEGKLTVDALAAAVMLKEYLER